MAAFSEDFLRFLKANYPDEYRRASVDNVKEDVVNAIMSRHASHYEIWRRVPEWVKNRYADRLPAEVLTGQQTPEQLTQKEIEHFSITERVSDAALDASVTLLAAGYTAETAALLAEQRALRAQLLAESGGECLADELLQIWLSSRRQDVQSILNDWQYQQPEKYALHLAKALSREQRRAKLGQGIDKQAQKMKIAALERELQNFTQQIHDQGVKEKMVHYLQQPSQQAALHHLTPQALKSFTKLMNRQGIKIEPNPAKMENLRSDIVNGGLTDSLRHDFDHMMKRENILTDAVARSQKSFERSAQKSVKSSQRKNLKAVRAKRQAHQQSI